MFCLSAILLSALSLSGCVFVHDHDHHHGYGGYRGWGHHHHYYEDGGGRW